MSCLQSLLSSTIAYARFHLKAHPREHRLHGIEHPAVPVPDPLGIPRRTLRSTVRQMLSVRGETPVPLRRISPPWIIFDVILL